MAKKNLPEHIQALVELPFWKLNEEVVKLVERIEVYAEENDGEIPPELDEEWAALGEAIEAKGDNIVVALNSFDYHINILKAQQKELEEQFVHPLRERRKAVEAAQGRLKKYVIAQLEREDVKRVDGSVRRLRVQNAKASVDITNPAEVPDKFKAVVLEMPREDFMGLKRLIRAHRGDDQLEWLTQFVTDEKIDKNAIYAASGEPEYIDGVPGCKIIPNKALVQF